ncbi:hypothetical protein [Rhizobium sp. 'Codium 1']|uniref:hypothetical protein n=1 Tax=Rhizobium sp. 'Codium 1' TaxID=2940484 RepID=UPI001E3426F9|nr:hypothetical protein [Rhizobium sp. 'Codium 1']MCC8934383.1 hypothetical protein [Rhizobium sp. 'Codium 1']
MAIDRPFRRTVRQFADGDYTEEGRWRYIRHPKFCTEPEHYIRAFELIQKDLFEIFDYIEPDDENLKTYSFRIHELFIRSCIELEANFKAILKENEYQKAGTWNINDYRKIEASHFLSQYEVKLPLWRTGTKVLAPFHDWTSNGKPTWYQEYHAAKHDRHASFSNANFDNLLHSVAGLVVVLHAQFLDGPFETQGQLEISLGPSDGYEKAIGGYFKVKLPTNIPPAERYGFTWQLLEPLADPFVDFPYPI